MLYMCFVLSDNSKFFILEKRFKWDVLHWGHDAWYSLAAAIWARFIFLLSNSTACVKYPETGREIRFLLGLHVDLLTETWRWISVACHWICNLFCAEDGIFLGLEFCWLRQCAVVQIKNYPWFRISIIIIDYLIAILCYCSFEIHWNETDTLKKNNRFQCVRIKWPIFEVGVTIKRYSSTKSVFFIQ